MMIIENEKQEIEEYFKEEIIVDSINKRVCFSFSMAAIGDFRTKYRVRSSEPQSSFDMLNILRVDQDTLFSISKDTPLPEWLSADKKARTKLSHAITKRWGNFNL